MSTAHKPAGYTTVSPYLLVDGANGRIEFLTKVLGAVELRAGTRQGRGRRQTRGREGRRWNHVVACQHRFG